MRCGDRRGRGAGAAARVAARGVEGAADGAGLGMRFLKHLSRTGLLLHLVDIEPYETLEEPAVSARKVITELEKWSDELASKPRWLVFNKIDRLPSEVVKERCERKSPIQRNA